MRTVLCMLFFTILYIQCISRQGCLRLLVRVYILHMCPVLCKPFCTILYTLLSITGQGSPEKQKQQDWIRALRLLSLCNWMPQLPQDGTEGLEDSWIVSHIQSMW